MERASLNDELQNLADGLAARVHQSVAVDDATGRLLAVSRHYGDADGYRVKLMLERKIPPAYREFFAPYLAPGVQEPIYVPESKELAILPRIGYPIYVESSLVAFLWLMDLGRNLQEDLITSYRDRMRELLAERLDRKTALGSDTQAQHIRDLIFGRTVPELPEAPAVEFDEGKSSFVTLSHYCDSSSTECEAGFDRLARRLPEVTIDLGFNLIANVAPDDQHVAVYRRALSLEIEPATAVQRLASEVGRILGEHAQMSQTCHGFGMSQAGDIAAVRELYAQAALAAFLSRHLGGPEPIMAWTHVQGPVRSLVRPLGDPLTPALGKLLRLMQDQSHFAFETVAALLHAENGIAGAAKLLSVHRTTLHYRIQQLHELTGLNLQLAGDRHLAFDLWLRVALARTSTGHLVDEITFA